MAAVIMAAAAVAFGWAIASGQEQSLNAQERAEATFLADKKIQELTQVPYSQIHTEDMSFPANEGKFNYIVDVESSPTNYALEPVSVTVAGKRITVIVWNLAGREITRMEYIAWDDT